MTAMKISVGWDNRVYIFSLLEWKCLCIFIFAFVRYTEPHQIYVYFFKFSVDTTGTIGKTFCTVSRNFSFGKLNSVMWFWTHRMVYKLVIMKILYFFPFLYIGWITYSISNSIYSKYSNKFERSERVGYFGKKQYMNITRELV